MIAVEDSDFPLVVVRVEGSCTDEQLGAAIAQLEGLLERTEDPYAVLVDVRDADLPTAAQLEMIAASMRTHEQVARAKLAGLAFVTANPATVAAIHALYEMTPIPIPTTIESRLSHARTWARGRMSDSQV